MEGDQASKAGLLTWLQTQINWVWPPYTCYVLVLFLKKKKKEKDIPFNLKKHGEK